MQTTISKKKICAMITAFTMIISLDFGFGDHIVSGIDRTPERYAADETVNVQNDAIPAADLPFSNHIVKAAEPPNNYTMNLFDYWGTDAPTAPVVGENGYWGEGVPWMENEGNPYFYNDDYLWRKLERDSEGGINFRHHLKFYLTPAQTTDSYGGTWNKSTQTGDWTRGIVNNTLNALGYPFLKLDSSKITPAYTDGGDINESLAYLFDPNVSHNGKASYENVKGLFQLDTDGYYYYDSSKNYAWLNGNNFVLYDAAGVAAGGSSVDGQFFPFNHPNKSYTLEFPFNGKSRADLVDYYNQDEYKNWSKMYDPSGIIRAGVGNETATVKVYENQAPDNEQNTIYFPSVVYWNDEVGNFGWTLHNAEFNGKEKAFEGKNFYVSFTVDHIDGYTGNDIEFYGRLAGSSQGEPIQGVYSGNKVTIDLGVLSEKYADGVNNAGMTWYAALPTGKYNDNITVTYKDFQLYYTESDGTVVNVDDNLPNPGDRLQVTYPAIFNEEGGKLEMAGRAPSGESVSYRSGQLASTSAVMNHWFGMSFEIDFQQPADGKINRGSGSTDMTFEFAGDDDIWVFIDDVLVMDLGGVHSSLYGRINFATGEIETSIRADKNNGSGLDTTGSGHYNKEDLYEKFSDAGKTGDISWRSESSGDPKTFADGSEHTIKVFYLERGGWDSNLAIKFNIEPSYPHQIYKIDAQGSPMKDVVFKLYAAKKNGNDYVAISPDSTSTVSPIATIKTDEDGLASFKDSNGKYINFGELAAKRIEYYILSETTPDGYKPAKDIILQYYPNGDYFIVVNKWESGAYASFTDHRSQAANNVHYALYDPDNGTINGDNIAINNLDKGLTIAVPVILNKTDDANPAKWLPLAGSNLSGWKSIDVFKPGVDTSSDQPQREALRKNLVIAALRQISDSDAPLYTMSINDTTGLLSVDIHDLPGNPNQYLKYGEADNGGNDGKVFSIMMVRIEPEALNAFGEYIYGPGGGSRVTDFATLQQALQTWKDTASDLTGFKDRFDYAYDNGESQWNVLKPLINKGYEAQSVTSSGTDYNDRGYNMVYLGDFKSSYRSVIYIPNEKRELIVRKVDTNGDPLAGAQFTLYTTFDNAADDVNGIVTGTTDSDGILIFNRNYQSKYNLTLGNGKSWNDVSKNGVYWLRETQAPAGYKKNPNLIEVVVNDSAVYVNASAYAPNKTKAGVNDNVKVYASVGRLMQNMAKYAYGGGVDTTLMDITATKRTYVPGTALTNEKLTWTDTQSSYLLHYYGNSDEVYTDYTLHKSDFVDGDTLKNLGFFEVTDGYVDVKPTQPTDIKDPTNNRAASREVIDDTDLHGLFVTVNIVEVADEPDQEAVWEPSVTKVLNGREPINGDKFSFTVSAAPVAGDGMDYVNDVKITSSTAVVEWKKGDTENSGDWVNSEKFRVLFKKAGVYTFEIREVLPSGNVNGVLNGITYDTTVYTAVVTVDVVNGVLKVTNEAYSNTNNTSTDLVFTNEYVPTPTEQIITVKKVISGRNWDDGETFRFKIVNTDTGKNVEITPTGSEITVGKSQNDPTSSTGEFKLKFTEAGVYNFRVEEVLPVNDADYDKETNSKNGLYYDTGKYNVVVTVTDDNKGKLTAGITSIDGQTANPNAVTVTNFYTDGILWMPKVSKTLNGRAPVKGNEFSFTIAPANGANYGSDVDITVNKAVIEWVETENGGEWTSNHDFKVFFNTAGDYTFTISEDLPNASGVLNGVTYDRTVYTVTVKVTANNDSKLVIDSVDVLKDGKPFDTTKPEFGFVNEYSASITECRIPVSKNVTGGRDWANGDEFSFVIAPDPAKENEYSGKLEMPDTKTKTIRYSTSNHTASFDAITFKAEGTYRFYITEIEPDKHDENMTYDDSRFIAEVTVKDDGKGKLYVESISYKLGETAQDKIVFVNTVKTSQTPPSPSDPGSNKPKPSKPSSGGSSTTKRPSGDTGTSETPSDGSGSSEPSSDDTGTSDAPSDDSGSSEPSSDDTGTSDAPSDDTGTSDTPSDDSGTSDVPPDDTDTSEPPSDDSGSSEADASYPLDDESDPFETDEDYINVNTGSSNKGKIFLIASALLLLVLTIKKREDNILSK